MGVTFSTTELEAAWTHVRDNEGCAGVDGQTIDKFALRLAPELARLATALGADRYRPLPLLEILVEKKPRSGKVRRLLVPAVRDRVAQTAAAHRLSRSFEDLSLDASHAYRPGRGVDSAVARVRQLEDRGYRFVVDADISSFFDQVEHSTLLAHLAAQDPAPGLLDLLETWIRAEFWDGRHIRRLRRGLPQGSPLSPLSPLLANFFLLPFDTEVEKSDAHLVRYADDCAPRAQRAEEGPMCVTV